MELNTHLNISTSLCGKVVKLAEGYAEVLLHTTNQMRADTQGLVHGGFVFGAADFAAMSAVNDPHVVLGSSTSKFLAPLRVSDVVLLKAKVVAEKGKKREVAVEAFVKDKLVFEGSFVTFVLDSHILGDNK
ncbi:MAG: Hot dog fold protein HP0420 / Methylthioribose-1-phosphate isomerase (EC [uncultured Sulfurovum sp.]|uniref:Hot dog fold protein HP0420 / Methylthioribose-1-phosphate isomerase (EC) n=1 Tax=uncultured Sulfurovum sp. TaxID=269237 RepID=A0A6S6SCR6_9BACT|nr:MAG: Hot dog fold protein HP0420 / Methylthioribose-1-phosphate isomerase (EC [uncultured Sulfurovum sp.]